MTTAVTYRAAPVLEIDAETVSLPVAAGDAPSSLITLGNEIKDTTKDVQRTDDLWITPEEAAQFMGIHVRNARRALAAREWRGHALVVREIHGQRARGGKALQVHVDSLPEAQRAAWWSARGVDIHSRPDPEVTALIEAGPGHDPAWKAKVEEARWKLSIIEPLMRLDRIKRAAAVADLIGTKSMTPEGKLRSLTKASLYGWMKDYRAGGLGGLVKKKRKDIGRARVTVTRSWDKFFAPHVALDDRLTVAGEIEGYIKSLWASGATWRTVSEFSTTKLMDLSDGLECAAWRVLPKGGPTNTGKVLSQFGVCHVNRRVVEGFRDYSVVHVAEKDAKRFHDAHSPYVLRDYSSLRPREIVVGDVRPMDVMMLRPNGKPVYPQAISWLDVATAEMYMTVVVLEPGEGVRRLHVAQSFAAMVEEWGLPRLLYLDNGSEYSWPEMMAGFSELSRLTGEMSTFDLEGDARVSERREAIIRSRAYNAKGKPAIEGVFGNLEGEHFSMMPGWTAGDRMNKKTRQQGKEPDAFPGDERAFLDHVAIELEWYHKRPQRGRLRGKSPNEVLRDHIAAGWGKMVLNDPDVLLLAFAEEMSRTVDRGYIRYTPKKGEQGYVYYHDALLGCLPGESITVRIAPHDPSLAFCFRDGALLCVASPAERYHPLDPAGAKEAGRRKAMLRREVTEKRKHCGLLSLVDETVRHMDRLPDAPEVPEAGRVSIGMAEQMRAKAAEEAVTRANAKRIEREEPRQFNQFGSKSKDPRLAEIEARWAEEQEEEHV